MYSERKWKEKLTEWKFDKNISATDMNVLVAKAEKRLHEEGKETVFYMGTSQITRERIEQFKRRKVTKEIQTVSPEAGAWKSSRIGFSPLIFLIDTPKNITYHTPPHNPPAPYLLETDTEDENGQVLESGDGVLSWFPYPGHGSSICDKNNERRNRLSNMLGLTSAIGTSEDDLSASGPLKPYTSSDTGCPEVHTIMEYVHSYFLLLHRRPIGMGSQSIKHLRCVLASAQVPLTRHKHATTSVYLLSSLGDADSILF